MWHRHGICQNVVRSLKDCHKTSVFTRYLYKRLMAALQAAKSLPGIYHGDAMACCNIDPSGLGSDKSLCPHQIVPCCLSSLESPTSQKRALFTFTVRISVGRKRSDVVVCDEGIASAMSEEQNATDDPFAVDRKLTAKVNKAQKR